MQEEIRRKNVNLNTGNYRHRDSSSSSSSASPVSRGRNSMSPGRASQAIGQSPQKVRFHSNSPSAGRRSISPKGSRTSTRKSTNINIHEGGSYSNTTPRITGPIKKDQSTPRREMNKRKLLEDMRLIETEVNNDPNQYEVANVKNDRLSKDVSVRSPGGKKSKLKEKEGSGSNTNNTKQDSQLNSTFTDGFNKQDNSNSIDEDNPLLDGLENTTTSATDNRNLTEKTSLPPNKVKLCIQERKLTNCEIHTMYKELHLSYWKKLLPDYVNAGLGDTVVNLTLGMESEARNDVGPSGSLCKAVGAGTSSNPFCPGGATDVTKGIVGKSKQMEIGSGGNSGSKHLVQHNGGGPWLANLGQAPNRGVGGVKNEEDGTKLTKGKKGKGKGTNSANSKQSKIDILLNDSQEQEWRSTWRKDSHNAQVNRVLPSDVYNMTRNIAKSEFDQYTKTLTKNTPASIQAKDPVLVEAKEKEREQRMIENAKAVNATLGIGNVLGGATTINGGNNQDISMVSDILGFRDPPFRDLQIIVF